MVAERRDLDTCQARSFQDGAALGGCNLFSVDGQFYIHLLTPLRLVNHDGVELADLFAHTALHAQRLIDECALLSFRR